MKEILHTIEMSSGDQSDRQTHLVVSPFGINLRMDLTDEEVQGYLQDKYQLTMVSSSCCDTANTSNAIGEPRDHTQKAQR